MFNRDDIETKVKEHNHANSASAVSHENASTCLTKSNQTTPHSYQSVSKGKLGNAAADLHHSPSD